MTEPKILRVEAFDGDCFGVTLSSGHTILLELGNRIREPLFAALIERGVFDRPQTDGERVFWQDSGPTFTVTEILAMVAQSGGVPQESVHKNEENSVAMELMKKFITKLAVRYFDPALDLRVRVFNVLAIASGAFCLVLAAANIYAGNGIVTVLIDFASTLFCYILLRYASRSGNYLLCESITIGAVFFVLFPVLFFRTQGYSGGMPAFLVFAVVFTVFMLDIKPAVIVSLLELALYAGLYFYTYMNPQSLTSFQTPQALLISNLVNLIVVSAALGATMSVQVLLYRRQQKKLDEQNHILEQTSKMKTELFANVSHEMKTPLTVISVHIQRAEKLFEMARDGDTEKIQESFALAQDEIMRMSRLVNSALKLASMQETGGDKTVLDISGILRTSAEAFDTLLEKQGNTLELDIPGDLPAVSGSADAIVQVLSNLLSNANVHTKNGVIRVCSEASDDMVSVTVEDNGSGIAPEILTHVFERGVTDGGGNGLGLSICQELVRFHGGDVTISSVLGQGTKVSFTLPVHRIMERK